MDSLSYYISNENYHNCNNNKKITCDLDKYPNSSILK